MIRNQTDSIVIKPKLSPAFRLVLVIVPLVIFIAGVSGAYYYGTQESSTQLARTEKDLAEQTERYEVLNKRYEQVQDSFAQMKRQLRINESAYSELRKELEQSNAQLANLRGELKFYRSIISPQDGKQGVRIQELAITPTEKSQTFEYKLVLIQTLQQDKELSGTVGLTIKGEVDGEVQTIQHPRPGEDKLKVKFKYFQNFTGILELPAEFKPLEIKVDLAGNKNKALIDDRWYPWLQVTTAKTS